jgi:hypothetical protein
MATDRWIGCHGWSSRWLKAGTLCLEPDHGLINLARIRFPAS